MAFDDNPIIVKRVKKAAHAHHGGAWKIAYADFVTAMMAFFLLLWLIAMASPEQKAGLADYFSPPSITESTSGSGGVMAGTALDKSGAQTAESTKNIGVSPDSNEFGAEKAASGGRDGQKGKESDAPKASQIDIKSNYDQAFQGAAVSIRQAWKQLPNITDMQDNLLIQETAEGLDIQITDQQGRRMFPEGSKYPFEEARQAIAVIAPILQQLPNQITISGHTAAGTIYDNPRYGPWELSSDRANAVREILGEFGLSDDHINSVIGRSTSEPFLPSDPYLAANERVRITVSYTSPSVPPNMKP